MIVWNSAILVNSGNDRATIVFPQQFSNSDVCVQITNRYSNAKNIAWSVGNFTKTGFDAFPLMYNNTPVNVDARASYTAIGRWK